MRLWKVVLLGGALACALGCGPGAGGGLGLACARGVEGACGADTAEPGVRTRLGQVPATLQRVKDFPSQLREHTLFQIKQLLERKDFTLATQAQLKLAEKLIEQQERLMEKVQ